MYKVFSKLFFREVQKSEEENWKSISKEKMTEEEKEEKEEEERGNIERRFMLVDKLRGTSEQAKYDFQMRALNHQGMALAGDFMNKFGIKIYLKSNVNIFFLFFFFFHLELE